MERILIATDLDSNAASALTLARALSSVQVRHRIVHVHRGREVRVFAGSPTGSTRGESLAALREHAATIPRAEHKMLEGDVATAILDEAAAWRADTIVLAPRRRSRLERFLTGSTSARVLRESRADVLLARSMEAKRLLVCTDLHEPSRRAAAAALRVARTVGAPLALLFAVDPAFWGAKAEAPWPPDALDIDADWLDRAQQEALHQWLQAKVAQFNATHLEGKADVLVREGGAVEAILRTAREDDLIVVGTHGSHGYERAMLGSVAERVSAQASGNVLVVKRDATA